MGVVLDDASVWIVMTEINGYRNIFGHVLYSSRADADRACEEATALDKWDNVWVAHWKVVGEQESVPQTREMRFYKCSECGFSFGFEERIGEQCEIPNYCPNCGARVKEDGDDSLGKPRQTILEE